MAPHRGLGQAGRDRAAIPAQGSLVYVEGRIQTRQWDDQEGQKRTTIEIVATNFRMLGGRGDNAGGGAPLELRMRKRWPPRASEDSHIPRFPTKTFRSRLFLLPGYFLRSQIRGAPCVTVAHQRRIERQIPSALISCAGPRPPGGEILELGLLLRRQDLPNLLAALRANLVELRIHLLADRVVTRLRIRQNLAQPLLLIWA